MALWERHIVQVRAEGPDADILVLRARAYQTVPREWAERGYAAMNEWNRTRRFLKAYLGEPTDSGALPVFGEIQVPVRPGITTALLATTFLAGALSLGTGLAQAQEKAEAPAEKNLTVDHHLAAAKQAAGFDYTGTLARICITPQTAPGGAPAAAIVRCATLTRDRWRSRTPFGFPVVPEVYCSITGAEASVGSAATSAWRISDGMAPRRCSSARRPTAS